jgi:two-component system cell cycle sensor histidine kinase/response regulator CckA
MINLCSNAFDAMEEEGGLLTVQLADENIEWPMESPSRLAPGQYVKLSVIDTGHGMSSDTIKRIFEPYFTTKDVGKGTGMGLAVVHGIVEKCGGHIFVESEIGKGTVFNMWFPAIDQLEEKPEPFVEKILPRGTEHILYVDDEESMAKMGQMVLERLDYQVKIATDPAEALDLLRNKPESFFKLVVTDFSMPGMTGRKLAEHIFSINPDLPVILCTGFSEQYTEEGVSKTNIQKCLEKPFNMSELASTVRYVLDSRKSEVSG